MSRSSNSDLLAWGMALAALAQAFLPLHAAAAEANEPIDHAVTVAQAKRQCFSNTVQATGSLVAKKEILVRPDLGPTQAMQVLQVSVQPGDTVKSGQVLARLSPPDGAPGGNQEVTAPVAGVIFSSSAKIGAIASSAAPPLFQIAERGELEVLADTPINSLQSLAPNQAAKIEVVGVGELSGKVRSVSNTINQQTQLGQIRISVEDNPRVRVGAFARATIELGQRCGPAVPLSAVLYGPGGAVVQVVRDNRVETRRVSIGLISGGQAEIREGVSQSEMVMARAGAFFRDGDRVRAVMTGEGTTGK
ncbi:MAG: HlyD family efflux transporter periplasmic adaptor subunit [Alphaproteobacteria bacterium]|nr:MAG: HlyD family efflux transporter periplasmic adaptor subunit [Alphaproteobacteria bacterium]